MISQRRINRIENYVVAAVEVLNEDLLDAPLGGLETDKLVALREKLRDVIDFMQSHF